MTDKKQKQSLENLENLDDIMACQYCKSYRWVGTHGASQFCQNKESPYYDGSDNSCFSWMGTSLTLEQELRGCDEINYNGQKIPAFLFKIIPKDSKLRNYPLNQIVDGFKDGMDLESKTTVEEITRKIFPIKSHQ